MTLRLGFRFGTALAPLLLGLAVAGCRPDASGDAGRGNPAGNSSSSWQLTDLEGKPVQASDFAGKVVLLNFWATWCGPCRMEIPSLIDLQRTHADRGLVVLGVSMDDGGPSAVSRFVKQAGINYPVLMANEAMIKAFGGIEMIPTSFVIDRSGGIAAKHLGFADRAVLEASIQPLLAQ